MKHAREDYNRIQDPAGLIPDDEPVFLLRAQDMHAAETLRWYASEVADVGGDADVITATLEQADRMDAWPVKKAPDITRSDFSRPAAPRDRTAAFIPDPHRLDWPMATDGTALANVDVKMMDDAALADYISACGNDYDGVSQAVREALVRLLRRKDLAI